MSIAPELLIASRNQGKVRELQRPLGGLPLRLISLNELPSIREVEETGATFAENARSKAVVYARLSGSFALADDSGLEVNALSGAPGVHSARFGGTDTSYAQKIARLLDDLANADTRRARFVSHIVFAHPTGTVIFESEGICAGSIACEPRGTNGFGYDPIFVPEGQSLTFGELPEVDKAKISHRAIAISKIIPKIRDFFANSLDPRNVRL